MPVIDPDADLIARLKARDENALEDLMTRRLATIHGLASRLLNDPVLAEDVSQSVMLKTWTESPKWEPGRAKLLTWMCRVTTNLCLDMLKKKRPLYSDAVPDIADSASTQFDALQNKGRTKKIHAGMAALPPRQRAALILCYFKDLSQNEAADVLDISVSAYESLLSRGRVGLREILQDEREIL